MWHFNLVGKTSGFSDEITVVGKIAPKDGDPFPFREVYLMGRGLLLFAAMLTCGCQHMRPLRTATQAAVVSSVSPQPICYQAAPLTYSQAIPTVCDGASLQCGTVIDRAIGVSDTTIGGWQPALGFTRTAVPSSIVAAEALDPQQDIRQQVSILRFRYERLEERVESNEGEIENLKVGSP